MPKPDRRNTFRLTITDPHGETTYNRTFTVGRSTNWIIYFLNRNRFETGTYTVTASAGDWQKACTVTLP